MTEAENLAFFNRVKGCTIEWNNKAGCVICVPHIYSGNGNFICSKGIPSWTIQKGLGSGEDQWSIIKERESSMVPSALKDYFRKHQDVLITLAVVMLADHFVFGGAFREKIKAVVERLISGAEKKVASLGEDKGAA